jgi:hypothetical protein|tara:strand:- start:169 stop:342 length:174 start_codon:yes stop_codon:yes gene_type:complete
MRTINDDTYDKLEELVESLEQENGRLYDLAQEILAENDRGDNAVHLIREVLNAIDDQ